MSHTLSPVESLSAGYSLIRLLDLDPTVLVPLCSLLSLNLGKVQHILFLRLRPCYPAATLKIRRSLALNN